MKKHLIINEDSLAIAISNIKNYAKKKEPFNVLIQPILEKRTSRQLRYYWVLISIIQDWLNEQGNQLTQDQTSDLMKAKFYNEIITLPNGEKRKVLKSISDKSETDIKEMAEYITKITVECAEWGIDIPFCDNDYNF
jgi:hypothetical protein